MNSIIKQYVCYIEKIEQDTFWALVTDPKGSEVDEYIEFDKDKVSEEDQDLYVEGAVLYWNIIRKDTSRGRKNESFFSLVCL